MSVSHLLDCHKNSRNITCLTTVHQIHQQEHRNSPKKCIFLKQDNPSKQNKTNSCLLTPKTKQQLSSFHNQTNKI